MERSEADEEVFFPSPKYSAFTQAVRAYRPNQLIPLIARMTARIDPNYRGFEAVRDLPPWVMAAMARESVVQGNEFRNIVATEQDVRRLIQLHHEVFIVPKESTLTSIIGPTVHEQFWWQMSLFEEQTRTISVFDDQAYGEHLDWTSVLGVPLVDAIRAGFILGLAVNLNGGRWVADSLAPFYEDPRSAQLPPREAVERVAVTLTATVDQLRDEGRAYDERPGKDLELAKHPLNPLMGHPLVDLGAVGVWAPVGPLVHRAFLPSALYVRGAQEWRGDFTQQLGRRHERYVGDLFRSVGHALSGELPYGKGGGNKTVDWIWVTPDAVVLIECKSAGLSLDSLAGGGNFSELVSRYIGRGRQQIQTTARHIKARTRGLEGIPADRRIVGLVVTSDPFFFANAKLPEYDLVEYETSTLVASVRDIEHLTSLPSDQAIATLIEIFDDEERSRWDLGQALRGKPVERHPVANKAWDRIRPIPMRTPPPNR